MSDSQMMALDYEKKDFKVNSNGGVMAGIFDDEVVLLDQLLGSLLPITNFRLGIDHIEGWHPGVCIHCSPKELRGKGWVSHGTKARHGVARRFRGAKVTVEPNKTNGLKERTTFFGDLRIMKLSFLVTLFLKDEGRRVIGGLDEKDLTAMQTKFLGPWAQIPQRYAIG